MDVLSFDNTHFFWLCAVKKLKSLLAGGAVALIGALIAVWLRTPLPWMLGPLILVAIFRMASASITSSVNLRYVGQWGIGVSLGLYFTPYVLSVIANNILPVIAGMIFALLLGLYGAFIFRKFGGVDLRTAWFSSAIGGASEMTSLSERYGGKPELVASAHSLRILTVVVVVPFIFQAWGVVGTDASTPGPKVVQFGGLCLLALLTASSALIAGFLRMPNGWVLGPMFVSMALTMSGIELSALPDFVSKTGQLLIGWSLGDKFRPGFFRLAPKFLLSVIFCSISSIVFAFCFAAILEKVTTVPLSTLILGLAPGGIAEMAITAKVLQLGVPLVTAFQVTRMALVVIVTGPLFKYFIQKHCEKG
jgi:membrane AbrB-like protein